MALRFCFNDFLFLPLLSLSLSLRRLGSRSRLEKDKKGRLDYGEARIITIGVRVVLFRVMIARCG